jgi:hypothetical protein
MSRVKLHETVRDRIEGEHAAIDHLVTEILDELDWLEKHGAKIGEPWDLPLIVASLRDHLERHFALEEHGGPLDRALHVSPGVRTEVTGLIVEHRVFSARIARLLTEMDCGFLPPRTVQACFALELRQVIADLREHEGTELLLFDRVFAPRRQRPPRAGRSPDGGPS